MAQIVELEMLFLSFFMVSLFFKILFIFPFQTKGQPEDELHRSSSHFMNEETMLRAGNSPEGLDSAVPVGAGPDILHLQRRVGDGKESIQDKCPALSFLRMPARTSCYLVDDAHRIFYGGTCSSLKGLLVTIMCSLAGSQEGRAEIEQPSHSATLLEGSFWVALNLNCMFSSFILFVILFHSCVHFLSFAFLAPGW